MIDRYIDCSLFRLDTGYLTGDGSSGRTYQQGVVAATESCCPALVFYENVTGVADRSKTVQKGQVEILPPLTEAGVQNQSYVL